MVALNTSAPELTCLGRYGWDNKHDEYTAWGYVILMEGIIMGITTLLQCMMKYPYPKHFVNFSLCIIFAYSCILNYLA